MEKLSSLLNACLTMHPQALLPQCSNMADHSQEPFHLDGTSKKVAIVGKACGKGGTIVEDKWVLALCSLQLALKCFDGVPQQQDLLFLLGEVEVLPLLHLL